jgi:hypothetical protein
MLRKLLGMVALVGLLSTPLSAHEQFRIVGKIVKFDKMRLDVETPYGETFLIRLQEYTPIQRDKKRVTAKELKVGGSVVVDVVGDTPYDADILVVSVTLVPPIAPKRAK